MLPIVHDAAELAALVEEVGLLPMFRSCIPGFSLEDVVLPEQWFQPDVEGPWKWRETVANAGRIAYAKLFRQKAGFVSMRLYPHLLNARRAGMDYETRYRRGLMRPETYQLICTLERNLPLLSPELRLAAGFEDRQAFNRALVDAMMGTDVTIAALEYKVDKNGKAYGWGVGRYDLSDRMFGPWAALPDCPPEVSMAILCEQVQQVTGCDEKAALRLLRY